MEESYRIGDPSGGDLDNVTFDTSHNGGVRDSEEMIAELRRENFRLRLLCYNYEKALARSNNPLDADSSRLFAAETKNMTLQDALAEKDALLNYVSKYLDELKRENSFYEVQTRDLRSKLESQELEWRGKYEKLYSELENAKSVDLRWVDHCDRKTESFRCENEYQNRIVELEDTIRSLHTDLDNEDKQADIFQAELNKFRMLLQQFSKEVDRPNAFGFPADSLNVNVSDALKLRMEDLIVVARSVLNMMSGPCVKGVGDNAPDCCPTQERSSRGPLIEISEQAKSVQRVSRLASPCVEQKTTEKKGSTDSPVTSSVDENYKQLVKRLKAARKVILSLGNEKLKQDKLIETLQASLETRERGQEKVNAESQTVDCLQERNLSVHENEVELLPSGLINVVSVGPPSGQVPFEPNNWSEVSGTSDADRASASRSRCSPLLLASLQKPGCYSSDSLTPLRSLHQLVLSLRRHLDTVQITQHSFVEMINRSLSTAGIDASFRLSPNEKMQELLNVQADARQIAAAPGQLTFLEKSTLSRAYATYGGVDTLFENFDESASCSNRDQLLPAVNSSIAGLNLTVAELRNGCPASPARTNDHSGLVGKVDADVNATEFASCQRSRLPVPKNRREAGDGGGTRPMQQSLPQLDSSVKFNFSLVSNDIEEDGLSANNQSRPGSMLAGNTSLRAHLVPGHGDVTVMEWEHRDLFERLLSAMSRLRDAIQDCSDASTELWSGDANCLSFLLGGVTRVPPIIDNPDPDQPMPEQRLRDVHPAPDSPEAAGGQLSEQDRGGMPMPPASLDRTPAASLRNISTGCESPEGSLLPRRMSARFDTVNPNACASGDEISLSHLYGSAWRGAKSACQSQTRRETVAEDSDYQQTLALLRATDHPVEDESPVLTLQDRVKGLLARLTDLEDRHVRCLEECQRLEALQHQSVPLSEYTKLREEIERVTSDMECTQHVVDQQAILMACLREFNLPTDSRSLVDCVNDLISELADLRSLEKLVDDSVKTLAEVVSSGSEPRSPGNLMDLVRSAVGELTARRGELDALAEDYDLVRSTLANLLDCSPPDSANEFAHVLETKVTGLLQELTYYQDEVEQSLDAMQNASIALPADCASLTDHVTVLLECLVDRERELAGVRLQCSDVRDALTEAVATISERDNEVLQLKDSLDQLRSSSVASDVYQAAADRLRVLEQQLRDASAALSTISQFPNQVDDAGLVGQVEALRIEFGHVRQYATRIESDYNSVVAKCKSLEDQANGTLVDLKAESEKIKSDLTLQLQQAKSLGDQLLAERDSLTVELSQKKAELASTVESNDKEMSSLQMAMSSVAQQLEVSEREVARLHQELLTSTLRAPVGNVSTQTVAPTMQHTGCSAECRPESPPISECRKMTPTPSSQGNLSEGLPEQDRVSEAPKPQSTPDQSDNSVRLRKYQELKTVAFELKDKLVSRTDKLEVALKEVARLRNVIQQDKERASRVLDEVEELRKQVLLKNKKIQILESTLRRLKAVPNGERTPQSSARAVSEREQPRQTTAGTSSLSQPIGDVHRSATAVAAATGTSIWPSVSENYVQSGGVRENSAASGSVVNGCAVTSLLFDCPLTPAYGSPSDGQQNATMHILDSSSLIFSPGPAVLPPENQPDPGQMLSTCRQCQRLSDLVVRLRRLLDDFRNGVRVDLVEEWSLLSALESADHRQQQTSCSPEIVGSSNNNGGKSPSHKVLQAQNSQLSVASDSLPVEVKENIKCLNHARVQLRHYAKEMDRLCMDLLVSCRPSSAGKTVRSQSADSYRVINRSVHLLKRVLKKLQAFFPETEVSQCTTIAEIFDDLKTAMTVLCPDGPDVPSSENKENMGEVGRKVEKGQTGSQSSIRRACACQHGGAKSPYEQRYYRLVHSLDKLVEDLSRTTDVLADARSNLEHTACGVQSPPTRQSLTL